MSNGCEYIHMVEYHYCIRFIHKTLNIPQSYPCTSCHSWFSSGSGPLEGFITQLNTIKEELEKKVRTVHV